MSEISTIYLTVVCVLCRRPFVVDSGTPRVVNAPAYCAGFDCVPISTRNDTQFIVSDVTYRQIDDYLARKLRNG